MEKAWETPKFKAQSAEFEAVAALCKAFRNLPAIVDDDYPEMRHYYESAVHSCVTAFKANGRP